MMLNLLQSKKVVLYQQKCATCTTYKYLIIWLLLLLLPSFIIEIYNFSRLVKKNKKYEFRYYTTPIFKN